MNTRSQARTCGGALAVLVLTHAGLGQRAPRKDTATKMFQSLDQNGDHLVSRREWTGSGASFLLADRDRDAYLDLEELESSFERGRRTKPETEAEHSPPMAEVMVAIGRFSAEPPDWFTKTCTACHDPRRILAAQVMENGWAAIVERMQGKDEADFEARVAGRVVSFLEDERRKAVERMRLSGSRDPGREWGQVFAQVLLAPFDKDQSGDLTPAEIARALLAACDYDEDGEWNVAEYRLLPVGVDRLLQFQRMDANHNGRLSLREFALPSSLMQELDRDGDGKLSPAEIPRVRPGPRRLFLLPDADRVLALVDRDQDGSLSARELSRSGDLVRTFDREGDNSLSREELESALSLSRNDLLDAMFDDFLTRYDLDGDGSVGPAEFPGPAFVFQRCDRDGSASISAKDAPRGWQAPDDSAGSMRWRPLR